MQAQRAVEVGDTSNEVEDRQGSLSSRRPKTPRCDGGLSPGPSPNARSRKIRKGVRDKDEEEGVVSTHYIPASNRRRLAAPLHIDVYAAVYVDLSTCRTRHAVQRREEGWQIVVVID